VSSPKASGDHFSSVSSAYAAFRPRYPRELFEFVASLPRLRYRAWDCGAGSGQASTDLAEHFGEVIATDVSAKQLAEAAPHPKIKWLVAPAESTPLASASIDLTAVAQALHWFDHPKFYAEVRRVSAPGAAIAAWTYGPPRMAGAVGEALDRYMFGTVGPFWPPERRFVEDEYRSIPFPFERIPAPVMTLAESWTLPHLAGYMRSWSATARYVSARGEDPVTAFEAEARAAWKGDEPRTIVWNLVVLAGRVEA
jgi:SAM-dependent methyltransferase